MILFALFISGLAAGVLGGLLGVGGGIFLVPALTILFHLPIRIAVGTSLFAVIATSAGVAVVTPSGRGGADSGLALRLEVATAAGALGGGLLAGYLSSTTTYLLFAVVVFITAGYMYFASRRKPPAVREVLFREDYQVRRWLPGLSMSAIAGTLSGLLGVGGGFIKVPVMYSVMEVPLGVATATSNLMVGITAAASVFVYYSRGDIRPLVAIPVAFGVFTGAILGVFVLRRVRVSWVRMLLIALLVVMGIQMAWQGLHP
jgi:uncharacterized membrane protein YfcA